MIFLTNLWFHLSYLRKDQLIITFNFNMMVFYYFFLNYFLNLSQILFILFIYNCLLRINFFLVMSLNPIHIKEALMNFVMFSLLLLTNLFHYSYFSNYSKFLMLLDSSLNFLNSLIYFVISYEFIIYFFMSILHYLVYYLL